jgi:hypothetical protein
MEVQITDPSRDVDAAAEPERPLAAEYEVSGFGLPISSTQRIITLTEWV